MAMSAHAVFLHASFTLGSITLAFSGRKVTKRRNIGHRFLIRCFFNVSGFSVGSSDTARYKLHEM